MREEIRNLFPEDIRYVDAIKIADYIESLLQEKEQLLSKVERLECKVERCKNELKIASYVFNKTGITYMVMNEKEIDKCDVKYILTTNVDGSIELQKYVL